MKIRAPRDTLANTLAWVGKAIPRRPTAPALAGVRIVAADGTLTLSAFDYDQSYTATIDVEVIDAGECLASGLFVRDIVAQLKACEVELVADDTTLTITAGRSSYRTPLMPLADYPTLPDFPATVGHVDADALVAGLAAVRYPINPADVVAALRGYRLEGSDVLAFAGTNRHVLATTACSWAADGEFAATVPVAPAELATKGLTGMVTVGYEGGLVGFADDTRAATIRCIAEDYPIWRRLVRAEAEDEFTVTAAAAELLDATKRIASVTDDGTAIDLAFTPGQATLSVAGSHYGDGTETVDADVDVEESYALNPHFLAGCLGSIPSGSVVIGCVPGQKALVLRAPDYPAMATVLMPIRKKN